MSTSSDDCSRNNQLIELHEDIISCIPDDIIIKILSFLPTKDMVRTCVLSKDWGSRWTSSVHDIIPDDHDCKFIDEVKISTFIAFVNRLHCAESSRINSFQLTCWRKYESGHINRWICTILRCKVEKLKIGYIKSDVVFPRCSLDSSYDSLKELVISLKYTLKIPHEKCFSQLTSLYIRCEFFEVQDVQSAGQLLLDFPVLQVLTMQNCKFLNKFVEFRAPALTRFRTWAVDDDEQVDNYVVKISAPNLTEFKSAGSVFLENVILTSPSLHYASLKNFQRNENLGSRAAAIMKAVPGLKRLKLTGEIVEALLTQATRGQHVLPAFNQLTQLDLVSECYLGSKTVFRYDTKILLEFLEIVPCLESLSLNLKFWCNRDSETLNCSVQSFFST